MNNCAAMASDSETRGFRAVMCRIIDWFHSTPIRLRVTKVSLALVLFIGVAGVFLASSGIFYADGTPIESRDSVEVVLEVEVKNFEIASPHGPIHPETRDWQINVVGDAIVTPSHSWIVRFRVTNVVHGIFESDEVRMLIHSPSQDGLTGAGQKFVLCLRRRSTPPRVVGPRDGSPGFPFFILAETLYEMVDDPRSTYPRWRR